MDVQFLQSIMYNFKIIIMHLLYKYLSEKDSNLDSECFTNDDLQIV